MNPYIQYMYSYPHKTAYRPLEGISLKEYAHLLAGSGHGLYLHIPFCQTKCGYCNLFSAAGQGEKEMDWYLDAVERQSSQYIELLGSYQPVFSEMIIGGGTPLLLTKKQLDRMFSMMENFFTFSKDRELVVETAPNQTSKEKLEVLRQAGVTRVSMGIQSFSDEELRTLRRGHRAKRAREALQMLMSVGFSCVNVDFIYGIPGQTVDSLQVSLKEAAGFGVYEIFLYPLYVKHGAGLVREGVVPDPEYAYLQYREMSEYLRSEGFRQDSMRRFVRVKRNGRQGGKRPFSECGFGTSLALGCGGRSYMGSLHFCTPYAVTQETCLAQIRDFETRDDFLQVSHGMLLSEEEMRRRYVIRHLLIRPGIAPGRYEALFHSSVWEDFPALRDWMSAGWLEESAGIVQEQHEEGGTNGNPECFLTLTEEGMGLSDYLGPMLVSEAVWGKMKEWEAVYEPGGGFIPGKSEKL